MGRRTARWGLVAAAAAALCAAPSVVASLPVHATAVSAAREDGISEPNMAE